MPRDLADITGGDKVDKIEGMSALTGRELQILELIALGYSAKETAQRLAIAHRTVEAHLDTMRLKLRARNRTHMVAIAIDRDLLPRHPFLLHPAMTPWSQDHRGFIREPGRPATPRLRAGAGR
jgi:LuxR family transcriptional regulator, transcriptional regulator of spore coat protein